MDGFIKLHRKIREWAWRDDAATGWLFVNLILEANIKTLSWHNQLIQRGQLVGGRNRLALITGLSPQSIRTCLSRLESTNEITIKSTKAGTVITIVNYDKYQGKDEPCQPSEQPSYQPPINQQSTTSKEGKNIYNISMSVPFADEPEQEKPKQKRIPKPLVWPSTLDTPENRKAFDRFKAHRKGAGAPMSNQQAEMVLKGWADRPERFSASIERSIAEGWKRIVDIAELDKPQNGFHRQPAQPPPRPTPPEYRPNWDLKPVTPETAAKCKAKIAELVRKVRV